MGGAVSFADLQNAGVKRVSMGVALYTRVMTDLRNAAKQLASGDIPAATQSMGFRQIAQLIANAT